MPKNNLMVMLLLFATRGAAWRHLDVCLSAVLKANLSKSSEQLARLAPGGRWKGRGLRRIIIASSIRTMHPSNMGVKSK